MTVAIVLWSFLCVGIGFCAKESIYYAKYRFWRANALVEREENSQLEEFNQEIVKDNKKLIRRINGKE